LQVFEEQTAPFMFLARCILAMRTGTGFGYMHDALRTVSKITEPEVARVVVVVVAVGGG